MAVSNLARSAEQADAKAARKPWAKDRSGEKNPGQVEHRGRVGNNGHAPDSYMAEGGQFATDGVESGRPQDQERRGDLQKFILDLVTITGGIVEVPSYALVNVALPGDIASKFPLPEFATLAFDYDVAKETPGAEFVTFGSPALDKFISLGSEVGRVIREFAMVSAIRVPQNLMDRIESKVGFNRCRRPALKTTTIQAYERVVFRFIVSYISDEKFSDSIAIAIDASTLADDTDLLNESKTVFWSDDPDMLFGSAGSRPMAQVAHKGGDGGEAPYVRDASGRARDPVSPNSAAKGNIYIYPGIPMAERRPYKEILDAALARLQEMAKAKLATYQVEVSGFCQKELVKVLGFYEKTLEDL